MMTLALFYGLARFSCLASIDMVLIFLRCFVILYFNLSPFQDSISIVVVELNFVEVASNSLNIIFLIVLFLKYKMTLIK